jgi:DNA replication and repair protein RecF
MRAVVARGRWCGTGAPSLLEVEIVPGSGEPARVNRAPVPRPREVLGLVRTVLFAPEDLALVKGDPSDRRRFLDDLLVARAPRYAAVRQDYDRVLRQRNALLKSAGPAARGGRLGAGELATLEVWDSHLARRERPARRPAGPRRGAAPARRQELRRAQPERPGDRSGRARLPLEPRRGARRLPSTRAPALVEALLAGLAAARRAELDRGVTLVGPHRDDLVLTWGRCRRRATRRTASRGLSRSRSGWPPTTCSAATSLRTASRCWCWTTCSPSWTPVAGTGSPSWWPALPRSWVTAAVAADIPGALVGARVDVDAGRVRPAGRSG